MKSEAHCFKERGNIVLVPQPSDDPNDPLNWPNWKRRVAYFSVAIFAGLGTWVVSGIGSGLILIMNEFGEDLQDTVNGAINWSILTLGFAVTSLVMTTDHIEFFLDPLFNVFWHKAYIPKCVNRSISYINLESQGNVLQQCRSSKHPKCIFLSRW
jgi:hypothetical protein